MDEKLIFQTEAQQGREIPLSGDEITFGRDPENTVVIDDIQISRHHLRVYREKESWLVEDLKSTNGSTLNGKDLKKAQKLKNGDNLVLGEDIALQVVLSKQQPQKDDRKEKKAAASEARSEARKQLSFKREKPEKQDVMEEIPDSMSEEPIPEAADDNESIKFLDKYPKWAIILMIAIAFIIVFCVIPFVVIEVSDQWCNLFSGFFNSVSPGVCP